MKTTPLTKMSISQLGLHITKLTMELTSKLAINEDITKLKNSIKYAKKVLKKKEVEEVEEVENEKEVTLTSNIALTKIRPNTLHLLIDDSLLILDENVVVTNNLLTTIRNNTDNLHLLHGFEFYSMINSTIILINGKGIAIVTYNNKKLMLDIKVITKVSNPLLSKSKKLSDSLLFTNPTNYNELLSEDTFRANYKQALSDSDKWLETPFNDDAMLTYKEWVGVYEDKIEEIEEDAIKIINNIEANTFSILEYYVSSTDNFDQCYFDELFNNYVDGELKSLNLDNEVLSKVQNYFDNWVLSSNELYEIKKR